LDKNLELISRRLTPPLLSDDLADGDVIKYDSASDSWTAAAGGTGTLSFTAKNASGGTMTVGQTVYISGNSGEVPEVDLARADSESTMPASGIISVGGNNNASVTVVSYGELSGIALPNPPYIVGEPVYVSSTVAGGIQSTVPATEANLIQNIGIVVREHASNGRIMVGGAGRTNAVPNLNSGNIFVGNASNQADDVSVSGDVTLSNTGVVTAAATQTNITSIPNLATVGTIGTGTWQGTAVADAYVANDLTIDGGTVDNSIIGGSTPAAGTFTAVNIAEDGKLDFTNTAPGTSGDATGIIFSFTAGATLAVGDVVYMGTGGKVLLSDANATTSMPALGICTSASTDTNPVDVMIQGIMKLTGWSFTVGADIFISGTAGDVTATAPSASGDTVQKVGVAVASDTVYFNFNTTELVLA